MRWFTQGQRTGRAGRIVQGDDGDSRPRLVALFRRAAGEMFRLLDVLGLGSRAAASG